MRMSSLSVSPGRRDWPKASMCGVICQASHVSQCRNLVFYHCKILPGNADSFRLVQYYILNSADFESLGYSVLHPTSFCVLELPSSSQGLSGRGCQRTGVERHHSHCNRRSTTTRSSCVLRFVSCLFVCDNIVLFRHMLPHHVVPFRSAHIKHQVPDAPHSNKQTNKHQTSKVCFKKISLASLSAFMSASIVTFHRTRACMSLGWLRELPNLAPSPSPL